MRLVVGFFLFVALCGCGESTKRECVRWTTEEDNLLIAAVGRFGTENWKNVANHVGTRNRRQCRTRWVNYCDPEIKNNAWTAAEEALLLQLHQVNGSTWAQFTRDFDGHSEVDIRNRYNRLIHQKPKPIPSREDAAAPGGELHYIASEEALLADIRASGEGAFLHDVVDSDPWDFLLDPIFNPMAPRNNKAHDPWDPFSWDFP